MSHSAKDCFAVRFGCMDYAEGLRLQMRICEAKKLGFEEDVLLLLEHPPTLTVGRNGKWSHLIAASRVLQSRNVSCFDADRGGDITFHGPGQLVGYPILKLEGSERDVHVFMRNLEESLIRVLADYEIQGTREAKYTGVWTTQGKIAALGIHLSRWITRHGCALNVNTDLSFFDLIVPCGIAGRRVTSMEQILSRPCDLGDVAEKFAFEFGSVFRRNMIWLQPADLSEKLRSHAQPTAVA